MLVSADTSAIFLFNLPPFTLVQLEWPKLCGVLSAVGLEQYRDCGVLSAVGLKQYRDLEHQRLLFIRRINTKGIKLTIKLRTASSSKHSYARY